MIKRRNDRQEAIREIVRNKSIRTQRDLVDALKAEGYNCTQATVSRDITDMGLTKQTGSVYVLAEDLRFNQMVSTLVVSFANANNLVVVKAQPGTAQGVSAAIDDASRPHMLGTVAGDDTILIVMDSQSSAEEFCELIGRLCPKERN